MCSNIGPPKALSYFTASFSAFLIILTIPGNFLVCLAIIKDPFRNLKTPFNYFLLSLAVIDLVVGTIVSCFSHQRRASTKHRRYQNLAHFILYFVHGVYFNTHGTYRGEICGRIIANEVQNNGYLQTRYFNIPVNLVGSTRVFFCILPTRIYILLLHFCKHCCSQHVWGSHLCSCRNTWTTATKIEILTKEESSGEHEIWCTGEPKKSYQCKEGQQSS